MNHSPAEIRDRWMNYGRRYARYPTLWDSSLAFALGPLAPEAGTLQDYSGRTAGAAWSVGAGDVPKYTQGSVRGQLFWAGQYDGTNDYLNVEAVTIPATGTAHGWIYSTSAPRWAFARVFATTPLRLFDFAAASALTYFGWYDADKGDKRVTISTLPLNAWSHVAVRWANGGKTEAFVNGVPAGTPSTGLNTTWDTSTADWKRLGTDGTNFLAGKLASFGIHNRVLTASEIATLAQHPLEAYRVEVPHFYDFPSSPTTAPWLWAARVNTHIGMGA